MKISTQQLQWCPEKLECSFLLFCEQNGDGSREDELSGWRDCLWRSQAVIDRSEKMKKDLGLIASMVANSDAHLSSFKQESNL